MNKNDMLVLYRYNAWANARILDAASRVTHEQFIAPASFPHGGLRGTLVHALFAEHLWRMRWEGVSLSERLAQEDFPTFDSLLNRWQAEDKKLIAFAEGISDERLNDAVEYKTTKGIPMRDDALWMAMVHLVNHGTQHRAEAAALLTDFGCSPGDIDMIVFMREKKG